MSIHAMVDLESFAGFSKQGGNYITQIGACKWNIDSGEIKSEFLVNCRPDPEKFRVDYDTIRWWFSQNQAAQKSLYDPEPIPLDIALQQFSAWFLNGSKVDGLWSHATFDVPALQGAYGTYGLRVPWNYRSAKDIRTLNWVAQDLGIVLADLPKAKATIDHNGLADAIEQATDVTTVRNAIREKLKGE